MIDSSRKTLLYSAGLVVLAASALFYYNTFTGKEKRRLKKSWRKSENKIANSLGSALVESLHPADGNA